MKTKSLQYGHNLIKVHKVSSTINVFHLRNRDISEEELKSLIEKKLKKAIEILDKS